MLAATLLASLPTRLYARRLPCKPTKATGKPALAVTHRRDR